MEDPGPFTVEGGQVKLTSVPAEEIPRFRDRRAVPHAVQVGDRSESIDKLMAALAKVQSRLKPAVRNAHNPFTGKNYADFSSVVEAAQYAGLGAEGIAYHQTFEQDPDRPEWLICVTTLHLGDQWTTTRIQMRLNSNAKNPSQEVVAASTYARRVGFGSATGVVADGEDSDGEHDGRKDETGAQRRQRAEKRESGPPPAGKTDSAERFLDAHPGLREKLAIDHETVNDIRSRLYRFGSISEKQIVAVERCYDYVMKQAGAKRLPDDDDQDSEREPRAQARVIDLMRECGFKMFRRQSGPSADSEVRVRLVLPPEIARALGWPANEAELHTLSIERMAALEAKLKEQRVVAGAAGGGNTPAPASPSASPRPPSRKDAQGAGTTGASAAPAATTDDLPF